MVDIGALVVQHPSQSYLAVTSVAAFTALSPTPSLIPLICLVTALHLQTSTFLPRRTVAVPHGITQLLAIAVATSITHLGPSLDALSTPFISIAALSCFSLLSSLVAFATLGASFYGVRIARAPWAQVTLFPALWASVWGMVAYISPVGRLITWSPVVGLAPYEWIRPVLGQYGIDWIVAAWAVVGAHVVGTWLMGSTEGDAEPSVYGDIISFSSEDQRDQLPRPIPKRSTSRSTQTHVLSLAVLLLLLTVPSFVVSSLPPSHLFADVTPFKVACALPMPQRSGRRIRTPTLEDYLSETKYLQGTSDLVLWPESAVRFDTQEQKMATFKRIQSIADKKYFGISFDEFVPASSPDNTRKAGEWRNTLTLIGSDGPVFEYSKRMLVPVAESFVFSPAHDAPEIYTIDFPMPKGWGTKPEWAPPCANCTRPISVTGLICLDFSSSSSLDGLPSRPTLILGPARTWHVGVGETMWQQARARAAETGSVVLWCDGGDGGVSGIAGGGMEEFVQVGQGSWSKTIGFQWPFDQRRTLFSRGGDAAALTIVWAIVGAGWAVERAFLALVRRGEGPDSGPSVLVRLADVGRAIVAWRSRGRRDEERPLLE